MANDERFLSMNELMQRYGLTRYAFYSWIRQGSFPAGVHFGKARRWPLSQLVEWEQSRIAEAAV